ncbi:MAG: tRNA (adenosine(37)-N6)-dimethylallyltransferase MiaA [Planctomycetota bacterium]
MALTINLLIGCTAGGKSRVALELARRMAAEIVSVDSMKIYRRMDIGTAKASPQVLKQVPHHMIDVVEPSESYSLARYLEQTQLAIHDIAARNKPVLAVGGTMLYVMGLTAGVFEGPSADPEFRQQIRKQAEKEGSPTLHAQLADIDPQAAARIHPNDLRRIERALEVYHLTGKPISQLQSQWDRPHTDYHTRIVALRRDKEETNQRINARVKRMIEAGLVDEVKSLLAEPNGIGPQAAKAVGYAEIIAHLKGQMTLDEAIEKIKINTRRLGKNQRTWMQRMKDINWVDLTQDHTVQQTADQVQQAWAR